MTDKYLYKHLSDKACRKENTLLFSYMSLNLRRLPGIFENMQKIYILFRQMPGFIALQKHLLFTDVCGQWTDIPRPVRFLQKVINKKQRL